MAKLSKTIAALLHLEKEEPDKREILIYHGNRDEWLKVVKVYEDVNRGKQVITFEAWWQDPVDG